MNPNPTVALPRASGPFHRWAASLPIGLPDWAGPGLLSPRMWRTRRSVRRRLTRLQAQEGALTRLAGAIETQFTDIGAQLEATAQRIDELKREGARLRALAGDSPVPQAIQLVRTSLDAVDAWADATARRLDGLAACGEKIPARPRRFASDCQAVDEETTRRAELLDTDGRRFEEQLSLHRDASMTELDRLQGSSVRLGAQASRWTTFSCSGQVQPATADDSSSVRQMVGLTLRRRLPVWIRNRSQCPRSSFRSAGCRRGTSSSTPANRSTGFAMASFLWRTTASSQSTLSRRNRRRPTLPPNPGWLTHPLRARAPGSPKRTRTVPTPASCACPRPRAPRAASPDRSLAFAVAETAQNRPGGFSLAAAASQDFRGP